MKSILLLVAGFFVGISWSEEGLYERSSISYVNSILYLDPSVNRLDFGAQSNILKGFKKEITLPRFEYNVISESLLSNFKSELGGSFNMDRLSNVANSLLVPQIVKILDSARSDRTAKLLSEAAKNSFMSDKAKGVAYTQDEVNKIMNSAWIMIPVAGNFKESGAGGRVVSQIDVGVLLIKLVTQDGKTVAYPQKTEITTSYGFGTKEAGIFVGKDQARSAMIQNAIRNLTISTKSIPDFKLSAQILRKSGAELSFDIGINEGINIDDKFLVVENRIDTAGNITQIEKGWVRISDVADTLLRGRSGRVSETYVSRAKIVGGGAVEGQTLVEFPRLPIELMFGGGQNRAELIVQEYSQILGASDSLITLKGAFSLQLEALYNFGRSANVHGLYFGLGAGLNIYDSKSTLNASYSAATAHVQGELLKKWSWRRLSVLTGVGVHYEMGALQTSDSYISTDDVDIEKTSVFANAGLELALSPAFSLAGRVSQFWGRGSQENVEFKNGSYGVGFSLVWCPPALPFDPLNFLTNF